MIVGENGAGKSTLLKIILGLIYPSGGTINTNNLQIAYVPEKINVPAFIKVGDFLQALADIKGGKSLDIDYYLDYWNISFTKNKSLNELSKGMLQKVIITQAFLGKPEVFIFDEALNGLDKVMQKKLLELIAREKKKNKIILITSHYQDYYSDIVDKTLEIKNGLIWEN